MQISVTELVTVLVVYTASTGSGLYWLWHRALSPAGPRDVGRRVVVMPVPTLIVLGVVRPGWPQH